MSKTLTDLRKSVFYNILDMAGKVYIVVKYSEESILPWTKKHIKEGSMSLVFNQSNYKNLVWTNSRVNVVLGFSDTTMQCTFPSKDIIAIFSPQLNIHFSCDEIYSESLPNIEYPKDSDQKVISLEEYRKRKHK